MNKWEKKKFEDYIKQDRESRKKLNEVIEESWNVLENLEHLVNNMEAYTNPEKEKKVLTDLKRAIKNFEDKISKL